ncbi:MAG TPA: winged helix-turn-helix domain-containing protein [Vicinamibacterales bacterium]|nr:winged helix-turn-helix domain-containing protein [Vicinamibacterales bacterium]
MTGSGDVFEFEEFRLDLRRMGVWKDDERVLLEPKALDVLRHLVANRDRLVPKDELLDSVWKDTFVTPNALTRAIAQLRKGLADDVEHPRLIETVAKRGYRFVARVTVRSNGELDSSPFPVASTPIAVRQPRERATARALGAIAAVLALVLVIGWRGAASRTSGRPTATLEITPLTASGDVIDAIISPDAKYLAFVRSSQGRQSLWIRQLHGTNPIQLVGPEAVSYYGISFAPDSASLYYVVRGPEPLAYPSGMLFQIAALGGTPRRLGMPFDHYPVVSPDGRFLASLRSDHPGPGQSALVIVNADGSGLRTVMSVHPPDILAPGFFIAPAWSPSGDRIAAAVRNADTRTAHLLTVDVATGAARRFAETFANASFASWMSDGSGIVFIGAAQRKPSTEFGSDLWFQPLPDGPPRPITTGIVEYRNVTASADGSSLVSVGSLMNAGLWRVPLAGDRLERIPSHKEDGIAGLAWLDAATIVFASFDDGTLQIWTMGSDGSNRHQITTDGSNFAPRATKDGRTIFFVGDRHGRTGLWRMDRTGANQRLIAEAPELWDLALSPDERQLLFTAPSADRTDSTWMVSSDGGQPSLLIRGLTHAAVSPDGRAIAGFWQDRLSAQLALAVFRTTGGPPSAVFAGGVATVHGGVWWSRDGRALYYTNADRTNVWRQPLKGGPATAVTDLADGMINRGDLSPDGRSLLAVRVNPSRDAFLITGFR